MNEREAFEAEYSKCDFGIEGHNFKKNPDGSYESQQTYTAFYWFKKGAALAQANVNEQSQAQQSTNLNDFIQKHVHVDGNDSWTYNSLASSAQDFIDSAVEAFVSQAQQERTKLIPMPTEANPKQWFFDCDDLYIDVDYFNGEVSIFVKHRSDSATGWKELIEKPQAQQPEYTFDQLTKMMMQAATKEGHKVTMKIKLALPPAPMNEVNKPEGGEK